MLKFFRATVLYRYILREYLKGLALALSVCSLIFLLAVFVKSATELEEFGITLGQVALLAPYLMPHALSHALPLSAMIAAILVFGRLAAENEIQAAQSGGASVLLLAVPALFSGFLVSLAAVVCLEWGVDWGFGTLRTEILTLRNPDLQSKLKQPGQTLTIHTGASGSWFINMLEHRPGEESAPAGSASVGRPIHITHFGKRRESLYAGDYRPEMLPSVDESDPQALRLALSLFDGQSQGGGSGQAPLTYREFKQLDLVMTIPGMSEEGLKIGRTRGTVSIMRNWYEAQALEQGIARCRDDLLMRGGELAARMQAGSPADPGQSVFAAYDWMETQSAGNWIAGTRDKIIRELVEFHRKLALAWMPLCLVFLGVGLGLLVRKSHRLVGFSLGILAYVLVYYPLMVVSKELAISRIVPPGFLWTPNILLALTGLALWHGHERGYFGGGVPAWMRPGWLLAAGRGMRRAGLAVWEPLRGAGAAWLLPFLRRADRHVATTFLAPFLTVMIAVGGLYVALDLVEHGSEVVKSVSLADQPLPGLEARSVPEALVDLVVYYTIRALGMIITLLPVLLLIAGVLAVTIMVRNNEHLIFKSSGTRLQRAFRPILLAAMVLSVGLTVLREAAWPRLVMEMDRLKPLVYHRSPKGASLAGQTRDDKNRPVIYELDLYGRNSKTIEGVRFFLLNEAVNGRTPVLQADRAVWDHGQECWLLQTEDPKGEIEALSLRGKSLRYRPGGKLLTPAPKVGPDGRTRFSLEVTEVDRFGGLMTPAFLDSEKYGPSVMNFLELNALRYKPEFRSEMWRRLFDFLTGFVLLLLAIPPLVRQEVSGPLKGIVECIAFGVAYIGINMGVAELARMGILFVAAPVLPHLVFSGLGVWRYYFKMET